MKHAAWFFVIVLVLAACAPAADESPGGDAEGSAGESAAAGETVEGSVRVALGDIEGVETLNLLIALERVRERGIVNRGRREMRFVIGHGAEKLRLGV